MSPLTIFSLISVIYFLPLVFTLQNSSYDDLWIAYKVKYKKDYDKENNERRAIWEEKVKQVAIHNLEEDIGLHSYRLELNKFSDMTSSEIAAYRKCLSQPPKPINGSDNYFKCDEKCLQSVPEAIDWRIKNVVTPVKDQGQCGSCWAFAATGALEGQMKLKKGVMISLSEQNLVDCSRPQGNSGCEGGWPNYAFVYIAQTAGIDTERSYPYEAKNMPCRFSRSGVGASCTGYYYFAEGHENYLKAAVGLDGPVSVAIEITDKFFGYKRGIFYDKSCTGKAFHHAVLVVGYGTANGIDYWIVKNSWGTNWGQNGYVYMARNAGNMCGIATHASFPMV